ncbi:MAG: hypothetical protein K2P98_03920, partial [Neisseriaceae bacterium]|nr:hypothetical protein [Neisseriaceae bacterium]
TITDAATSLEAQQAVVWMEKGKANYLVAGNKDALAPDYDLSHFMVKFEISSLQFLWKKSNSIPFKNVLMAILCCV